MNHLLSPGKLLDENGNLKEAGYALSFIKEYHRSDIRASKYRIKEWDYYYVGNHEFGIAITIDDNSYMDLCSVSFFNYRTRQYLENSTMHLLSLGKRKLPETSVIGDVSYRDKKANIHFDNDGQVRHLYGTFFGFLKEQDISFDIKLSESRKDSIVMAIPFEKEAHFYYNQKINNLIAEGKFVFAGQEYILDGCQGVLDWGRGVWTRKNTWYWASMNDTFDGHNVGFNFGYGFGDTSKASENIFFYDDKSYKLDDVTFDIPKDKKGNLDFAGDWKMTSSSGDVSLVFHPWIVRRGGGNALIVRSKQRQVFGAYEGFVIVDGKKIEIKDCHGFAEKVVNYW